MDRLDYHCIRVLQENWNRFACPDLAVVVYELPDGTRAGWCGRHRQDGEKHALARGWKRVEPALGSVA